MGKRKHDEESKAERKERKRQKKEAKKEKKRKRSVASVEGKDSSSPQKVDGRKLPLAPSSSNTTRQTPIEVHSNNHSEEEPPQQDDDRSQSFIKSKLELTVSLLPSTLGSIVNNVEDSLRKMLLRYSDGIRGIMLAFDNVKLLDGGKGSILNELPFIHYRVTCDTLVFRPLVGCTLNGKVTGMFPSHLSLVVHNFFNASISAEKLRQSGFDFDEVLEAWSFVATEDGSVVSKGDLVEFDCHTIHESGGIISMDGTNAKLQKVTATEA